MKGIKQIDDYIITKELSKEKEIILYEGVNKKTNEIVVIKAFPTSLFQDKRKLDFFKSELKLISGFNHPNIIQFYTLKKTEKFYYLIMEYCNGGKLSEYKAYYEKANKCLLKEEMIQRILKETLCGLSYMHNCNTMHRNLNLDNIELNFNSISNKVKQNQNPVSIDYSTVSIMDCTVKISNLSFAKELDENGVASTVVGSPIFMAPDVIVNAIQPQKKEFYNANADLWSLGAITYELLVGKPLFDGNDITAISKKLNEGNYSFPLNLNISIEAMTFIDGLIQYTQDNRIKWNDLVNHAFIKTPIETFHYLDIEELKVEGIIKELRLNIKQNNNDYLWSKSKMNNKLKQNNINTNKKDKEQRNCDQLPKEMLDKKNELYREMLKIETEKLQTEQRLLQAAKDKKEAEELKQRTELEKTRLNNYDKNLKEINEEKVKKKLERNLKEETVRQQEIDKLNKEKERIEEEKRKTEQLENEAKLIMENAEKIKQEVEVTKKEIQKQNEQEDKIKNEELLKRQLEEQKKFLTKTKLIEEINQKEGQHNFEIAQLKMNVIKLKKLSNELKTEALEKKKIAEILEEKEQEHKKLLLQIEQITNEKEKKLLEIQQIEEKEKQKREEEKIIQTEKQIHLLSGKQMCAKKQIEIGFDNLSNLDSSNNNTNTNTLNNEWECYSTKSIELDNNNIDISDYVLVGDYVSSKEII